MAFWGAQNGAIVTDAETDGATGASGAIAKLLDELEFAVGHVFQDTGEKVRLSGKAARIY